MPLLAKLGRQPSDNGQNAPFRQDKPQPIDYFSRGAAATFSAAEEPARGRKSPSSVNVSPLSASAILPGSGRLPKMYRHASSPLAYSVPTDPSSSNVLKRGISGLLRRTKTRTPDVDFVPVSSISPPPPAASPPSSAIREDKPKLKLRTMSDSFAALGRRWTEGEPAILSSTGSDIGEGTFKLVSFRSARDDSPVNEFLPPADSPVRLDSGPRTPPMGLPASRPSSQLFNDPLSSSPTSASVKASYFKEARAARSSNSLPTSDTNVTTGDARGRPLSTGSRLDLPVPSPTGRAREPLVFVPSSSTHRPIKAHADEDSLALSSTASRTVPPPATGAAAPLQGNKMVDVFIPQPAFDVDFDQNESYSIAPLPMVPQKVAPAISDGPGASRILNIRDKAKQLANGVYLYTNDDTEELGQRLTSEDETSFDATVTTDSEDGISDAETSETSQSNSEERPAWNTAAAQRKREDAQRQAQEATTRFRTAYKPPPSSPPLAPPMPLAIDHSWSATRVNPSIEDPILKDANKRVPATNLKRRDGMTVNGPRSAPWSMQSSEQMAAQETLVSMPPAVERPSQWRTRPSAISRPQSQDSLSSFSTVPPTLTGSPSVASLATPRTPEEGQGPWTSRNRPVSFVGSLSGPPSVDPVVWSSLSFEAQHAIEEQGWQLMATLAKQAAKESDEYGDITPRYSTPLSSPIDEGAN